MFNLLMSVLWLTKIPLGRLLKLFLRSSPLLSLCLKRLSRKMSKPVLLWEFNSGVLVLRIPEKESFFTLSHNSRLECYRGSLSLLEFFVIVISFLRCIKR